MRTVIVTGGSRGLGLATAVKLAGTGYNVVAVARQQTSELTKAIDVACGGKLQFRKFDLGQIEGLPSFVKELRSEFGTIYGLVNNAGIGPTAILASMRDKDIVQTIGLNTASPLILTKHVVRSMLAAGEGRIVNIASIVGLAGHRGLSVYAATKASLIGFTKSLAREIGAAGITVNVVSPGFVDTDMTRGLDEASRDRLVRRSAMQRLVETKDVANAVAFLLSDEACNITGTVLTVDAGTTA